MPGSNVLRGIVDSAGLSDLWEPAVRGEPIGNAELHAVLRCGHPLAAAALADARRHATSDVIATTPWTLRVRAPGVPFAAENGTRVSHAADALGGIAATEAQIVGAAGHDLSVQLAVEMVRTVRAARPDLSLRAFDVATVKAIGACDGGVGPAVRALAKAGLDSLDWAAGDGLETEDLEVHHMAHAAGLRTVAPLGYGKGGIDAAFLERLDRIRRIAEETAGFVSVALLPDRSAGASPLHATSGTEDTLACALARLGLGHAIAHVTVDAHILGHKLSAVLLSCGADDFVGAQAAAQWAPPSGDGPRPLNPDRVRRYVIEARRSPELRNTRFDVCEATTG